MHAARASRVRVYFGIRGNWSTWIKLTGRKLNKHALVLFQTYLLNFCSVSLCVMHKDSKFQNDLRLAKDRTVDQHSDTWEMHFNLLELCLHNLTAVTMIQVLVEF